MSGASQRGIAALIVGMALVALTLWTTVTPVIAGTGVLPVAIVLLALAALAAEWFPLTLEHRGETMHMTLSGLVVVLGVIIVGPLPTLGCRVVGGVAALVLRWRMPPQKLAFNATTAVLEVWAIAAVLSALAPDPTASDHRLLGAIVVSLVAADAVTYTAVIAAMRTVAGSIQRAVMVRMAVGILYSTALSALFAALGVVVIRTDVIAAGALVALFALLATTNWSRHTTTERFRNLSSLYQFIDAVHTAPRTDDVVPHILREAEEGTGTRQATLFVAADGVGLSHRLVEGEMVTATSNAEEVRTLAAATASGMLLPEHSPRPVPSLTGAPGPQVIIASFLDEDVSGVLLFDGRRGNLPRFDDTDLRLALGLIRHAGSALLTSKLVADLRARSAQMRRMALFDPGTGLPNREGLLDLAPVARAVAVLEVADLDDLTSTFGHPSAERVTSSLAARLAAVPDAECTAVARITHDRFAVTFDTEDPVRVQRRTRQIRDVLQMPMPETGVSLKVRILTGIATAPTAGTALPELLQAAVGALASTRAPGGQDLGWYDPAAERAATQRVLLASDLTQAILEDQISVVYQPKLDLRSGAVVGVEALARWTHPDGQTTSPEQFIDLAERTGLIVELTRRVIDRTVRQVAAWQAEGRQLSAAINFSADCLRDVGTVTHLLDATTRVGINPDRITVEITESLILGVVSHSNAALTMLAEAGVRTSLDDFGTGYSSLAQLRQLPVHELKIDRAFIGRITASEQDRAIVGAIMQMARSLGLTVVAEGVEDLAALEVLRGMGCDQVQGFHVGRPMTGVDLLTRLRRPDDRPDVAAPGRTVVPIRRTGDGRTS